MNIRILYILALCLAGLASPPVQAQRRPAVPKIEELPRLPLDTLSTEDPETRIVLYTNNTWDYHRPTMALYDELPVYAEHWDTSRIFSYRSVELTDLPERIDLCLINSAEEYHAPITGAVRSPFGIRRRRNHNGIDIPLRTGDPIYATFEGKVRYAKYNTGGYGNLVIVRHKNGLETWYAHLSRPNVTENQYVKAGQVIGYGGNTGRSTGPHLHYEVRYYDQVFDPQFLIAFPDGGLKTEVFALERSYFNIHSRASEELIEDEVDDAMWDAELQLLAEMGDTTASRQLLANAVAREQEAERKRQEAARAVYHTVAQGDILGTIARRYGVSIDQICRLNSISRTTTLRLGRQLRIK
jgi:murein DD-endopeptidase MepM/ murein hydrolase activator NlpD